MRPAPTSPAKSKPKTWKAKEVAGRKVYQRDDIIDPDRIDPVTGLTNLELMKKGKAPLGPDGREINLHHATQDEPGTMVELTASYHSKNHKPLHMYTNQYDKVWKDASGRSIPYRSAPPSMNRGPFNTWKKSYWKERAGDFGG